MSAPSAGVARFAADHPVGDPERGQVRWLLGFARPATRGLALSTLARFVHLVLGAALLALPAWTIGHLAAARAGAAPGTAPTGLLVAALFACAAMALIRAVLRYAEQLLGHRAAFGLLGELRVWTLDRLTPQAPAALDGEGAGHAQSVAHRDVDRVEVFFAHTIAPALTAVAVPLLAVVVGGAWAGWPAGLALAVVMMLGVALPWAGARRGADTARRVAQVRARIAQQLADDVRARADIASFGATGERLRRLGELDAELEAAARGTGARAGARSAVSTLRVWGGTALVLAVALAWPAGGAAAGGAAPAERLDALAGALLAAALVPGTAGALDVVERLALSLPAGLEATRRLRRLAAAPPAVRDTAAGAQVPTRDGPVGAAAQGVHFAYPGRPESGVTDLDVRIAPGAVIALVGATGSGKSSVARLLQRRWDVDAGVVTVAGRDVRDQPLARTWRDVVVADQSAVLLDATVRENLTLGTGGEHAGPQDEAGQRGAGRFDDAAMTRALATACLDDVVAALPQGLDTRLGPRGVTLSGGQAQRLALARAVLHAGQDALLVLDEVTSHQDARTQERIVANLRGRRGGTLIVAHRLATVRDAEEILVLERGRVVERGTWDELATSGGAFATILRGEVPTRTTGDAGRPSGSPGGHHPAGGGGGAPDRGSLGE